MRVRLAWVLFGLTVLVALAHVALLVASDRSVLDPTLVADGFPLVTVGAVAGAGVGALIVSRYPGHLVGWLFVVGQFLSEVGLALRAYGYSALSGELGDAPGGHLANWLSHQTGGVFVVALLTVLFLIAPDGHLLSPRWRWGLALPLLALLGNTLAIASIRPDQFDRSDQYIGEPGPVLFAVLIGSSVAVALGTVVAAVSLILRLRRSRGDERQQLRWMALAAGGIALGMASNWLLFALSAPEWLQPQGLMLAYVCVPLFTGVAILRYRLYEIDVLLNRAITLGVLTGVVAVGYVAVVVTVGNLLPLTDGRFWPSLVATALVALAVQPLRKWVERLADRLVYGRRAAPYVELAEFSKRLQESPGTEELLRRLAETVARAVGARQVSITLAVSSRPSVVGWPQDAPPRPAAPVIMPVVDEEGQVGEIVVTMPPGVVPRPDEGRLLADFALQLGQAFRKIELESELVERIDQLQRRTEELAASSRRLQDAQHLERERFQADVATTVVPHLVCVREGLEGVLEGARADAPRLLDDLSQHTQAALESLRTLTRGVFPSRLARRGLVPALDAHLAELPGSTLHAGPSSDRRYEPRVESTAYFCAVEFLRHVGGPVAITIVTAGDLLRVEASGRSSTGAADAVAHLRDRAAALGGTLRVGNGTGRAVMLLELPLKSSREPLPDAAQAV